MTQIELNINRFGEDDQDFKYLKTAVNTLMTKNTAQFEDIKNEKWFHRIFDFVTFSKKKDIRVAEQITSITQAQEIVLELLKKLTYTDVKVNQLVKDNAENLEYLSQGVVQLASKVKELKDEVKFGLIEQDNLDALNMDERKILSGLLFEASKYFDTNANQRKFANSLVQYYDIQSLKVDPIKSIDSIDSINSRALIYEALLEYGFLYNETFEFPDELTELLEAFDFSNKKMREIKENVEEQYKFRGIEGFFLFTKEFKKEDYIFEMEINIEDVQETTIDSPSDKETSNHAEASLIDSPIKDKSKPVGCSLETELLDYYLDENLVVSDEDTIIISDKKIIINANIFIRGTLKFVNCSIAFDNDIYKIYNMGNLLFENSYIFGEFLDEEGKICEPNSDEAEFIAAFADFFEIANEAAIEKFLERHSFIKMNHCTVDFTGNLLHNLNTSLEISNTELKIKGTGLVVCKEINLASSSIEHTDVKNMERWRSVFKADKYINCLSIHANFNESCSSEDRNKNFLFNADSKIKILDSSFKECYLHLANCDVVVLENCSISKLTNSFGAGNFAIKYCNFDSSHLSDSLFSLGANPDIVTISNSEFINCSNILNCEKLEVKNSLFRDGGQVSVSEYASYTDCKFNDIHIKNTDFSQGLIHVNLGSKLEDVGGKIVRCQFENISIENDSILGSYIITASTLINRKSSVVTVKANKFSNCKYSKELIKTKDLYFPKFSRKAKTVFVIYATDNLEI